MIDSTDPVVTCAPASDTPQGLPTKAGRFHSPLAAFTLLAFGVISLAVAPACSLFQRSSSESESVQPQALRGSDSAEVFQRIREAKSQNAIVLQVNGDSTPIRVLPLPPDGESVFVSDLLKQTGVQDKLGRIHATLYRPTPEVPSGIKMDVKFSERSGEIRPETDYALQPGDRLRVIRNEQSAFSNMFDQFLPSNGARAFRGY